MPKYNFDDCYEELDEYCSAIRSGNLPPLSLTMRKVIKDTAIVNAEDPYWDDGSFNQHIPYQIQGKCSTRDALKGLQTLFMKIHEAYSTKKNPTPETILQMVYGQRLRRVGLHWTCKEILGCWWICRRCTRSCLPTWPRLLLEMVCLTRTKEITSLFCS